LDRIDSVDQERKATGHGKTRAGLEHAQAWFAREAMGVDRMAHGLEAEEVAVRTR
jgi:hypothetical protein